MGHLLKGDGAAIELLCQFLPAGVSAVGHKNFVNARLKQMHGSQFRHFTRAHQHGLVFPHVAKDAFGKLHGGVADGNRAGSHRRFSAHPLGHRKSLVQQPVEYDSGGAAFDGLAIGGLQLTEYLRLAQHHRIQARRH